MSLVQELQRDAIGSQVPTSELLRKALVVARKLEIPEFRDWISLEIQGYPDGEKTPGYRMVYGELIALNPVRGPIPVYIQSDEVADIITRYPFSEPISKIEDLVAETGNQPHARISREFPHGALQMLREMMTISHDYPLYYATGAAQLKALLHHVRNTIFDWSLKLEEDGITGEGLSFSREEKQMAAQNNYHIENFIGSMQGSQIQQKTSNSTQNYTATGFDSKALQTLLQGLGSWLPTAPVSDEEREEIVADLETVRSQSTSPKPKPAILQAALSSIKSVLEGAATRALTDGLKQNADEIGKWIGRLGSAVF